MNDSFPEFYKTRWIKADNENLEETLNADPDEKFLYEKYFNLMCRAKSNFNFFDFFGGLDGWYNEARIAAKSCLKRGMEVDEIAEEDVEVWFEDVTKCINFLLVKTYQLMEDKKIMGIIPGKSDERNLYNKIKVLGDGEWEPIIIKLNELYYIRNDFLHRFCTETKQNSTMYFMKKISHFEIRGKALKSREDFLDIHMQSLTNIKKTFTDFEREMDI